MKRLLPLTLAVTAFVVAGCDSRINAAKSAITHVLIDPDSAKWRDMRVVERSTSEGGRLISVCGEVNSKNRMGGMAGYEKFAYVAKHVMPKRTPVSSRPVIPAGRLEFAEHENKNDLNFPISDDRGNLTVDAICEKTSSPLPSGIVDYVLNDPCENTNAERNYDLFPYVGNGTPGSLQWVGWKMRNDDRYHFSSEDVCDYIIPRSTIISNYLFGISWPPNAKALSSPTGATKLSPNPNLVEAAIRAINDAHALSTDKTLYVGA